MSKPFDGFTGDNDGSRKPLGRSCPYCARYEPTHYEDCPFLKRTVALTDLEGFTKRNVQRAKKAADDATKRGLSSGSRERIEAEARLHDAERFHLVVSERVKEALK